VNDFSFQSAKRRLCWACRSEHWKIYSASKSFQQGASGGDALSNGKRSNGSPAATTEQNHYGRKTEMQLKVLAFSRGPKPAVLASVRVEMAVEGTSDSIVIDDARVLRNKHGQLWLAMPSYSFPSSNGRYEYCPAVLLSIQLKRDVEDAVLPTFEAWEHDLAQVGAP
jgi:DNA-binding cell septation regulator SpoVG